jgi:DNA primase large subunit
MQGTIKLEDLEGVSRAQFPPCMRNLYDSLRRDHHLKYHL